MRTQTLWRAWLGVWVFLVTVETTVAWAAEPGPDMHAVVVVGPRLVHMPAPVYPSKAMRMGVAGTVLVHFAVTTEGATAAVVVRRSSGSPELDAAALAAVTRWRFDPARNEVGDPVGVRVDVPIQFELESPGASKSAALAASAGEAGALSESSTSFSHGSGSAPVYRPSIEVTRPRTAIILAPRGR